MEITVSINQIISFILYMAGFVALVYLAICIRNINLFIKELRLLLITNKENIDSTMDSLPLIATNVNSITSEVRESVESLTNTAESIQKNISNSTNTTFKKAEITVEYIQIVGQLLKLGIEYFGKIKHKYSSK